MKGRGLQELGKKGERIRERSGSWMDGWGVSSGKETGWKRGEVSCSWAFLMSVRSLRVYVRYRAEELRVLMTWLGIPCLDTAPKQNGYPDCLPDPDKVLPEVVVKPQATWPIPETISGSWGEA